MILIITFPDNQHVERVRAYLKADHEIVDLADFPRFNQMYARAGRSEDSILLRLPSGRTLSLDDVSAVWNRRHSAYAVDEQLTDHTAQMFAWSETTEAVEGLWHSMDCWWMNHPADDDRAMRKVAQHRVARRVGLRIPETLVTNCPSAAGEFIEAHADTGVVRKAFRNIPDAPRETALVGAEEMRQLDAVRFAPVLFQEYIPLALDLRCTVVDGEVFTTAFRSTAEHEVDYRSGIGSAEVFAHKLPDTVEERLMALMDHFNLKFGAVDFRVTPEGEYVYLEVNPAGEYLFACERTGQPVPQAIAAALERHA